MKFQYGVLEVSNHWATYHSHYKDKLEIKEFRYNSNFFHKSDYLVASFFTCNGSTCIAKSDLVTKKAKSLKTSSVYTTDTWVEKVREAKTSSLIYNLMLSKICPAMFEYLTIFKYAAIFEYNALSKSQLSFTLIANLTSI